MSGHAFWPNGGVGVRFVLRNEDHWREVGDLFGKAALNAGWERALNSFADACGGTHGQLLGVSPEPAIRFNWLPRLEQQAIAEWEDLALEHASARSLHQGLRAPVLRTWHDEAMDRTRPDRDDGAYDNFRRRYDIACASQTNLVKDGSGVISLAVLRSHAQGAPDSHERRAFEVLAPLARSAVTVQKALEGRGFALLSGALEALGRAAFVCDGAGQVRAATAQTEPLLQDGVLRLAGRRLSCRDLEMTRRLEAAVALAGHEDLPSRPAAATTQVLRGETLDELHIIDVIALPKAPYAFGFDPRMLVLVRQAKTPARDTEALLQQAYALTPSEARVAVQLGDGESPDAIAAFRRVSTGTIRTQVRAIYQKMDVRRQVEFAARLAALR